MKEPSVCVFLFSILVLKGGENVQGESGEGIEGEKGRRERGS